ncbi:MAG TPA: hypothetical protein VLJ61_10290 [Pyrinomonadaceae bacterium]|nr:hypothetical protein [Pyrinomonadaceae bacterium]
MNCREFENSIDSLARGALADSRTREEATAHEASCVACAARLTDEHALTSALRALASSMKEKKAHARVEAALLSSFRANAARVFVAEGESKFVAEGESKAVAKDESAAVAASNVLSLQGRASVKGWSWAKSLAVASLAAAAAVALFVLAPRFAPAPSKKTGDVAKNKSETDARNNSTQNGSANVNAPSTTDEERLASSVDDQNTPQPLTVHEEEQTPRVSSPRRTTSPARASEAAFRTGDARGSARPGSETVSDAGAAEIATDFIPMMQGGSFGQAEGGHLVRVELPRSAMASFGLPVNYERAGGRVKADVLLGDDGIARAIRFVR